MKVFEAVAEALAAEDIEFAFVVLGHGNMEACIELPKRGVQLRSARHEAAAVAMAEGYSLATGKVAFASVTRGPGLTQLGTSFMMASRNAVPMVILTGDITKENPGHVQAMDQRRFVEACECGYETVRSPDSVYEDVAVAFYRASVERRPVVLSVDASMQEMECPDDIVTQPVGARLPTVQEIAPDEVILNEVVTAITSATKVVIIAGRGALGATQEIRILAELLGAVVLTTLPMKGFLDDYDLCLGVIGAFVTRAGVASCGAADLVIAIGASLNKYTLSGNLISSKATIISVNIDPVASRGSVVVDKYLHGESRRSINEINQRLANLDFSRIGFTGQDFVQYVSLQRSLHHPEELPSPTDGLLDPRVVVAEVDAQIPSNGWIVIGQGHYWAFPIGHMRGPGGPRFVVAGESGAVGNALGTAIGYAMARPDDPVVLFEGDGSLMMHIQELDTVVRYRARLLIIVMNDEAFGSELHSLRARGVDPTESMIPSPKFDRIGEALGWVGRVVTKPGALELVVEEFLSDTRPYIVDARISREVRSETSRRLEYGEDAYMPLLPMLSTKKEGE